MEKQGHEAPKELKQAEDSEESCLYRLLVDSVSDQALVALDAQGVVVIWSKGAAALTGWQTTDVLGKELDFLFSAETSHSMALELRSIASGGSQKIECQALRHDGSSFRARISVNALSSDDLLVGFGVVIQNITAQMELDRLRDDSVAMVAHDLRTPVSVIAGFAEMLTGADLTPEARARSLQAISDNANRLVRLVDDILETARVHNGSGGYAPSEVDLVALATRAVDAVIPPGSAQNISVEAPRALPPAWADEARTWQVLTNLVNNAVRYASDSPVVVRLKATAVEVEVEVADRGPGIAQSDLQKLFQRFGRLQSSDGPPSGAGLGLWICRQLVESQGGHVWVRSALGEGAVFGFSLPLAASANPQPSGERWAGRSTH